TDLDELRSADVVIEAAPENLDLKRSIFSELERITSGRAIIATNTSTLSVAAITAGMDHPGKAAGLHFFNPAPVLPLVELVKTEQTAEATVAILSALAGRLEKTSVITRDVPGFIVNRVARPFYGEALRLLGDGVARAEEIDRLIVRGAGFRMGPFRLMDLIGIDVNFAAMKSMYDQTFGEPRYRPHWIQSRMVAAGTLGRKTGRGFYDYSREEIRPDPQVNILSPERFPSPWVTPGTWAPGLGKLCVSNGVWLQPPGGGEDPSLVLIPAGRDENIRYLLKQIEKRVSGETAIAVQCSDTTLSELTAEAAVPQRLVGFDGLFLSQGAAIALTRTDRTDPVVERTAASFFRSLKLNPIWVADSPGLVLPRIVAALANEASFAVLEGVADADTIDRAMRLGVNYPRGPIAWAREIGFRKITAILDHMRAEFGEERHRPSVLLRRWARLAAGSNGPDSHSSHDSTAR
ncbi:MAG: 3-hydroxyacyl-CoA dehydrogenase family protein, partial [Anaerolineales bacterium]|nr:3-hydroxyacyl-CoA dehydrogenase family protein [Anaerolineales bacterium]